MHHEYMILCPHRWQDETIAFASKNALHMQYFSKHIFLKSCSWKGKEVPCSAIFKKVATDKGICCAFNSKAANETYKGDKYTSLLQKFENEDKLAAFDQTMDSIDLSPISGVYQI